MQYLQVLFSNFVCDAESKRNKPLLVPVNIREEEVWCSDRPTTWKFITELLPNDTKNKLATSALNKVKCKTMALVCVWCSSMCYSKHFIIYFLSFPALSGSSRLELMQDSVSAGGSDMVCFWQLFLQKLQVTLALILLKARSLRLLSFYG